jgi:hypothetical protein
LSEMLRVARRGVVLFETGLHRPTLNQRIYMAHSGYSRALPQVAAAMPGVTVERLENIVDNRFFGAPNVQIVLRKKSS